MTPPTSSPLLTLATLQLAGGAVPLPVAGVVAPVDGAPAPDFAAALAGMLVAPATGDARPEIAVPGKPVPVERGKNVPAADISIDVAALIAPATGDAALPPVTAMAEKGADAPAAKDPPTDDGDATLDPSLSWLLPPVPVPPPAPRPVALVADSGALPTADPARTAPGVQATAIAAGTPVPQAAAAPADPLAPGATASVPPPVEAEGTPPPLARQPGDRQRVARTVERDAPPSAVAPKVAAVPPPEPGVVPVTVPAHAPPEMAVVPDAPMLPEAPAVPVAASVRGAATPVPASPDKIVSREAAMVAAPPLPVAPAAVAATPVAPPPVASRPVASPTPAPVPAPPRAEPAPAAVAVPIRAEAAPIVPGAAAAPPVAIPTPETATTVPPPTPVPAVAVPRADAPVRDVAAAVAPPVAPPIAPIVAAPVAPALARPAAEVFAAALAAPAPRKVVAQPLADAVAASLVAPTPLSAPVAVDPAGGAQQAGIDLTRDPGLHRMIDHIEHLRDAADARDTRIRLIPDSLGPVDVSVRRDGDRISVHFTAEQASTRTLIADAQPRLNDLAESRGVRIAQTTVDTGAGGNAPQSHQRFTATAPSAPAPARAEAENDESSDARVA